MAKRRDLDKIKAAMARIKNPPAYKIGEEEPKPIEFARESTGTALDEHIGGRGIDLDPTFLRLFAEQDAQIKEEKRTQEVLNQLQSQLFKSGGGYSDKTAFDKLSPQEQRSAYIDKDLKYFYYPTR